MASSASASARRSTSDASSYSSSAISCSALARWSLAILRWSLAFGVFSAPATSAPRMADWVLLCCMVGGADAPQPTPRRRRERQASRCNVNRIAIAIRHCRTIRPKCHGPGHPRAPGHRHPPDFPLQAGHHAVRHHLAFVAVAALVRAGALLPTDGVLGAGPYTEEPALAQLRVAVVPVRGSRDTDVL